MSVLQAAIQKAIRPAIYGPLSDPAGGVTATGGTIVDYTDGGTDYRAHIFTASDDFTVLADSVQIEYLVIGGGGSNLPDLATGGAGAGGYRSSVQGEMSGGGASAESPISLSKGVYAITVGAAGALGSNGSPSSIAALVVSVGGGGHPNRFNNGGSTAGGSGTGANRRTIAGVSPGGAGTAGQGYSGGASEYIVGPTSGGGGGGAGGAGESKTDDSTNAAGGAGVVSNITGTLVTRAAGGCSTCSTSNAIPNSGNGGNSGNLADGLGGSGLVVIRYEVT